MTMKRLRRILAFCLVFCMSISMFACRKQEPEPTAQTSPDGNYTVTVSTEKGMPLAGIGVYIYTDKSLADLVWFAKTDDAGQISFSDTSSGSYVAVLKDVPTGYVVEEYYSITGADTQIRLPMELVDEDALAGIQVKLGDAMFDFTVTACDGTEYKLSELLEQKEAVVLNFWYVECSPCKAEFPSLQEAYEKYSDKIEILALNPVNADDEAIAAFQKELGLTFPMAQCSSSWESAMQLTGYPTTVVIDRYGVISFMHMGSVTDSETFEDIFAFFTAEDYEQTVVKDLEEIESEDDEDDFENPTDVGGVTSFEVQVEPGEVVYVNVYKITGTRYVSIKDKDAYIVYNNKTYSPSNGTVSLAVTSADTSSAVVLGFGNNGEETKIFKVNLAMPTGTIGNPYTMELGEFNVKVPAGNSQGVYYLYRAKEAGVLTVELTGVTAGVPYGYTLYNLSTGAYRILSEDAGKSEAGNPILSVKISAGNSVQLIVSTLPDSSGSYPSGNFSFNAYVGEDDGSEDDEQAEKIIYSVSITDESRAPISGATVYLDVDGTSVPLTTNESGVAATKLVPGTYAVTLKFPSGYTGNTSNFTLTEAIPNISIKLDKKEVVLTDYTVTVVDASGAPISGALVAMGGSQGYTDATGQIKLTLDKDTYTVYVIADGYVDGSFTFEDGATTLTASMTAGSNSASGIDYTVKVVDYSGKPIQNVSVTFLKEDGSFVAMKQVGADGTVTHQLAEGNYTVSLAFSGSYWYNTADAVLSADKTSITITAYEKCGTEGEELHVGGSSVGIAYHVYDGATYISGMQSNVYNYYLFTPEVSGTYQITAANSSAEVSYWGASTFPNLNDIDLENNAFTINVKESMLGISYVIGLTKSSDAVLIVTRIGDAVLDESDLPAEVYEGAGSPTEVYKVTGASGKTLTYFDLTAGSHTLVLGSDGYYHLNSATGPLVYVNLGQTAPYIQFSNMFGVTSQYGTGFKQVFYEEGVAIRKEDYAPLMTAYCQSMDETYGLYPLNEDLMYMIQQGGDYAGWWDAENANYLFVELAGLNANVAWMFACCYFK